MNILFLTEAILSGINSIQDTLYLFYQVSLVIGYCILVGVLKLYEICCALIFCVREVIVILNEDFDIFINDIACVLCFGCSCIKEAASKSVLSIAEITNAVLTSSFNFISALISLLELAHYNYILDCVKILIEMVYGALCLIGLAAYLILEGIWTFLGNIPTFLYLMVCFIKKKIIIFGRYLSVALTHEAVFGMVIVTGLTFLSYRSKLHYKLVSIARNIFSQVSRLAVKYFCDFISLICVSTIGLLRVLKFRRKTTDKLQRRHDEMLCVVCLDKKRTVTLLNCRHLVLCKGCTYIILRDNALCPVCRAEIIEVVTVYT